MKKQDNTQFDLFGLASGGACWSVCCCLSIACPSSSMLFTVLKKGAIYALVAVSMNLLNGFTGLFTLGQAGFMLLGAYTYGYPDHSGGIERISVYQYFDGGIVQFADAPDPLALIAGRCGGGAVRGAHRRCRCCG